MSESPYDYIRNTMEFFSHFGNPSEDSTLNYMNQQKLRTLRILEAKRKEKEESDDDTEVQFTIKEIFK